MKKMNAILKFSVFILLLAVMASCNDEEEPKVVRTPETEAKLISQWKTAMKNKKNQVDSLEVETGKYIYYIMDTTKVGTGPNVKTGDELTVSYVGLFLDGISFDSSDEYTYIHKDTDPQKRMIPGWEAGIELLNKGATAAYLIPSRFAYGATGSYGGVIPPYTPLIFVIEVTNIK
ncbi:MAG TPA: FKBP-type peptidyl-prolyl cis-trans isomerase [Prolixibacteraceae bacterium]|nr:FKBP-type peptidyl-prolyl cis-trans isomerase [Prolixibacteraceae bacterium]